VKRRLLLLLLVLMFVVVVWAQEQKADKPITTETLRELFFQEKNPDFKFPARKERYIYNGPPDSNCVALTFDDGPNPQWTRPILEILKEKKVPATFFLIGENVQLRPDIVRDIVNAGCEVGNHSFNHPNMKNLTPEKVREQLEKTREEIKKACGIAPQVARLPYGVASEDAARIAFDMRLDLIFWSLDTDDYKKTVTKDDMLRTILKEIKPGSIILMHDRGQKEVDTVKEIIDPLRAKGLEFVTCSELAARVRMKKYQEGKLGTLPPQPHNDSHKGVD